MSAVVSETIWKRRTLRWHGRAVVAAALFVLAVTSRAIATESAPSEQLECARAYEAAQEHRLAGKLLAARMELQICRQQICTDFISDACGKWFAEVNATTATVTFDVRLGERPVTEFQVVDNGIPSLVRFDGDPLEVDPGEHLFEIKVSGATPLRKRVVLQPGEKNRPVRVILAAPAPTPAPSKPTPEPSTHASPWPYVLSSIGVLGVSGFAALGIWGVRRENDLRDQCAPNCTKDDVSSIRTQYLVADVSLGVGVLALAAGTYLWLSLPEKPPRTGGGRWRLGLLPSPTGATGRLERSF